MRNQRGVTAIEFGLLAFPFFTIVAGILQTSVIFLASQVLESAVQDAARNIRTGIYNTSTSIETFRQAVCDRLYSLYPDCAGLHVIVNEVTNFQSATVLPPIGEECEEQCEWAVPENWQPGGSRSVVLVQVHYRYPVYLKAGPLGMSNLPDGNRLISSTTVFQNEPY